MSDERPGDGRFKINAGAGVKRRLEVDQMPRTPGNSRTKKPNTGFVKSNLVVFVRLRPFTDQEKADPTAADDGPMSVAMTPTTVSVKDVEFQFDRCFDSFDPDSADYADQETVYSEVGRPLVKHALDGFNCCLFAYGHTGSGKSYTMLGQEDNPGVIPRFIGDLFEAIISAGRRNDGSRFAVRVSYFEIYNEKIRDLLSSTDSTPGRRRRGLPIRQHPVTGPFVDGLFIVDVKTRQQMLDLVTVGDRRRAIGANQFNDKSSRSHTIFAIEITKINKMNKLVTSKVNLVDLAGNESVGKDATALASRIKEGNNINKSLLALGKVMSQLADANRSGSSHHVNYRDSTLTWILKESLGGNSKTSMIATISPAKMHFMKTIATLQYASIAKKITNLVCVNDKTGNRNGKTIEITEPEEIIKHLEEENKKLREEIKLMKKQVETNVINLNSSDSSSVVILGSRENSGTSLPNCKSTDGQTYITPTMISPVNYSTKPGPPRFVEVDLIDYGHRANLLWRAPLSDGGSEILKYRIERQVPGKGGWVMCGSSRTTLFWLQPADLQKSTAYQFRVIAENNIGSSEPSVESAQIKTRRSCRCPWCGLNLSETSCLRWHLTKKKEKCSTNRPDKVIMKEVSRPMIFKLVN